MKIETLLEKITPLPWRWAEMDNDKVVPTIRIFGRRKSDPVKEICFGRIDSHSDAAYLVHAANHFPKLLEALEEIYQRRQKSGMPITVEPWTKISEALTQAREVKG